MGSVTSEEGSDQQSERYGSYSLSADVSESESSSGFSYRPFDHDGASSSMASSPLAYMSNFCFATPRPPPPLILPVFGAKEKTIWNEKPDQKDAVLSEVEMMKERFAKLLLGEDMSGGGKGVCTALAISNAITNLSATVFGELWRLEPLAPQKKSMWCREMEWLLSVSDSIVEFVPSVQQFPGGGAFFEVMATRPRSDLYINLPALKKLDAMLLGILDAFRDTEFWYVDRGIILGDGEDSASYSSSRSGGGRPSFRQEDKWWLPYPRVPPSGLSDGARKKLQQCKDCTSQILKAAMAINSGVLAEMDIPNAYLETLPKNGKSCVGACIYGYLTSNKFNPESVLDCLDFSTEHHTIEIANDIEASIHVWRQKNQKKHTNHMNEKRSSWGVKVKGLVSDNEKNHLLAKRAESLLRCLRQHYPGLPQTALDMSKIQYNKDVGQAILESYSRVMESLAFNVMARIDDLLYVDDAIKRAESVSYFNKGGLPIQKKMSPSPFSIRPTPYSSPFSTPPNLKSRKPDSKLRSGARKVPTE